MDRWLCAGLVGYALSFSLSQPLTLLQWLGLAAAIAGLYLLYQPWRRMTIILTCVLCGIGWGSGNAYLSQSWQLPQAWENQSLVIILKITEIPHIKEQQWRVQGHLLHVNDILLQNPPKVRLNWYQAKLEQGQSQPQAGETWRLKVRLKRPQGVRNEGGFLYHRYLLSHGIRALGTIQAGEKIAGTTTLRQQLFNRLRNLDLAQTPILSALLLGERQLLSDRQWQTYQRTGVAHLIAISGLHLSLVAGFGFILGRWLSIRLGRRRQTRDRTSVLMLNLWLALLLAFGYAWLAGFATATVRAFAMLAVIASCKQWSAYTPHSRILLRAIVVVCVVEPLAPLQSGFWLSVAAVAAILIMNWRWLSYQGKWRALIGLWRLELMLTLALWPLALMWFGGLPVLAPMTNLILVPVFSVWVLPVGLLGLFLLILHLPIAAAWILKLAELPIVLLEPALVWLAQESWQWLPATQTLPLLWLGSLLTLWLLPWRLRYRVTCTLTVLLAFGIQHELAKQQRDVKVHILDVGQGSAVVIERQGYALLVDVGASWEFGGDMAQRSIIPFLRQRRLTPELAFVSHTDNDHRGGSLSLKQSFPSMRWYGSNEGSVCAAGQRGVWRGVKWHVLHPRHLTFNRYNDDSCVLKIEYQEFSVLLPGDISKRAERELLAHANNLDANILVLAHHGSNSSSEDYFLQHVQPELAIASRGWNNAYGMVSEAVKERLERRGIPLLDTAVGGQITLTSNGASWQVSQPYAAAIGSWFDADN